MKTLRTIAENAPAPAGRTRFLDHLKVFLTVLVVLHHAGQPYGPTGGAWPVFHAEKFRLLGPFFHINASFFMGLFFLISGYMVPRAYAAHGAAGFLRARLWRLGLPIVLFGGGFLPLVHHWIDGRPWDQCFWPFEWAHLWYLGHLLVLSLFYAAWRNLPRNRASETPAASQAFQPPGSVPPPDQAALPGHRALLGYALLLALATTVVRIWFPIDLWVYIGIPAEVAHLPQYLSLFVLGVVAGPRRWLERIPAAIGRPWLVAGVALIGWRYSYSVFHASYLDLHDPFRDDRFNGLLSDYLWWQWEALLCTAMCVGLPYAFRRYASAGGQLAGFLSRHAFLVYVTHLPVLVTLQMALDHSPLGPLALTLLTGAATLALCYGLGAAVDLARLLRPELPAPDGRRTVTRGGQEAA